MTTPSPGARPRVAAYDYAAPTEADALAALQRVFGPARGHDVWSDACREAVVPVGRLVGTTELERTLAALARQGGAAATVARAMTIRMRTFTRLATRAANVGVRP